MEGYTNKIGSKKNSRKKLGIMMIGAGSAAEGHLDYLVQREDVKLTAVADPNPKAREKVKQKYECCCVVANYKEVLESKDIDVVLTCAPHNLHHPIALDALCKGKARTGYATGFRACCPKQVLRKIL